MIDKPLPFKEAIEFVLDKSVIPSGEWDDGFWRGQEEDVKLRSFWSAKVENARFLDRAQSFLFDTLAGTTEKVIDSDGEERVALRGGGRATFVRRMREFMIKEGIVTNEEEFFDLDNNDISDTRSERRLLLVYDTNIRQAYGYGQWRQGQKPSILYRYPAQKFIRVRNVETERPRHSAHEGDVRLKNDKKYWADYQNDPEIGGFGVPWPPFGFGSGMGVRDVSRETAEKLGLDLNAIKPDLTKGLNKNLKASVKNMSPEVKQKLLKELRSHKRSKNRYAKVKEDGDFIMLEDGDHSDV